ncbi:MAG: AmmeMemoRadiSam system radical SAM enzyme [Candidatus Delongbacteria bacterium]
MDSVKCRLCAHECLLPEGKSGICGVNRNTGGKIECAVYGHPIALNIDPVEKKPLSRFMAGTLTYSIGTLGCNLKCEWCQNYNISQTKPDNIEKTQFIPPERIVDSALNSDCRSISYTYNEPTVFYPYAKDIGRIAKEKGLKNIFVSNGYQSDEVIHEMLDWVDAINVDLKCFNADNHRKHTGADLDVVLKNLKILAGSSVHLEITTLIIPGLNDSDKELTQIADFIAYKLGKNVPWHVSAFYPVYKMTDRDRTPSETIYRAVETGRKAGLEFVYAGNIW